MLTIPQRLNSVIADLRTLLPAAALACFVAVSASPAKADDRFHRPFDKLLKANVIDGHVNYPAFVADAGFAQYLKKLGETDAQDLPSRAERLAFWINAYNAFAIKGILDGGSPSSFFGRIGYFTGATYTVANREINLYDIEHVQLIPLGEPRVHFAINCASVSCPPLRSESYSPATLAQQLDVAATAFINDAARNTFDTGAKVARVSKIFDWYDDEFGADPAGILNYIAGYVSDPKLADDLRSGQWTIEFLDYDWSLNGTPPSS